jgi:hypothetical protein
MAEDDLSEEESTQLPDSFAYVIEQIQNGQDDMAIELSLADNTGMSRGDAFETVKEVHAYLAAVTEAERLTFVSRSLTLSGGAAPAILGGVFWWLNSINTQGEVGFVALGLGFLTGCTVRWMSRGKRGEAFRGIAAFSAVFGVVVGKYLVYVQFLKEAIKEQSGETTASPV